MTLYWAGAKGLLWHWRLPGRELIRQVHRGNGKSQALQESHDSLQHALRPAVGKGKRSSLQPKNRKPNRYEDQQIKRLVSIRPCLLLPSEDMVVSARLPVLPDRLGLGGLRAVRPDRAGRPDTLDGQLGRESGPDASRPANRAAADTRRQAGPDTTRPANHRKRVETVGFVRRQINASRCSTL